MGLGGCSTSANFFRVNDLQWNADAIEFSVRQTDSIAGREHPNALTVDCLNCNLIESPEEPRVDSVGRVRFVLPEANTMTSALLHVHGRGLDTVVLLKQRSMKAAQEFYGLTRPIIGRILVTQFSILFADSALSKTATHAERNEELNLFGEDNLLFFVHHPLFKTPLYLPKTSGVRLY
jgi:hypothetical protein